MTQPNQNDKSVGMEKISATGNTGDVGVTTTPDKTYADYQNEKDDAILRGMGIEPGSPESFRD